MMGSAHRITGAQAGDHSVGMLLIWTVHLLVWVFRAFDLKFSKAINVSRGKYVPDDSRETPGATLTTFDLGRVSVICSCLRTTACTFGARRWYHGIDVVWLESIRYSIARSFVAPVSTSVRLVPQCTDSDLRNALHPLEGVSQAVAPSGLDDVEEQFR